MTNKLKKTLDKLPYIRGIRAELNNLKSEMSKLHVPPGHFYSPTISKTEIEQREHQIWGALPKEIAAIDLNEEYQLSLLNEFLKYYNDLPFESSFKDGLRYYYDNEMFSYSEAIFLFCMIRKNNPKRIIEVGSGFSSAVMLDTNNLFFNNSIQCTFIEPYPDRLKSLLFKNEQINLIESPVQDVETSFFEDLEPNDILFIDSTHVSKTGSDVNYLIFEVLPKLKKGVKVHFHDIHYPFEYPKEWILEGKRSWNENYILRAFLSYNKKFKIIAFNTFLQEYNQTWFKKNMPLCLKNKGASIWLEVQ